MVASISDDCLADDRSLSSCSLGFTVTRSQNARCIPTWRGRLVSFETLVSHTELSFETNERGN